MNKVENWRREGRWLEPALATAIVGGILYCCWFLYQNHYLPYPFFYEPTDTYADWFNTGYWARNPGAYDTWRTVYPPLSFVFLRLIGIDRCYSDRRPFDVSAGLDARSCDWVGLWAIWIIFFINIALVWYSLRKIDRNTASYRTICVSMGLPMLDAIERGNLAIVCFSCLVLSLGPLLKSARLRWLAAGLVVNFKIYLISAIAPLILRRRWRWVECAILSAVLVYLLSYAIFGHGDLFELLNNIRDFSGVQATQITDVWYTTTYQSLMALTKGNGFPLGLVIGSRNVVILSIALPLLQYITQAFILAAMIATWFRPEVVPNHRIICFGILLAIITSEAGGYSQIYFMLFVMMEPWRGAGRRWAIFACYVLALPLDIPIDHTPSFPRETYIGGATTYISYYVTVGPFLRPLIIMTVAVALALVTIQDVWRDLHYQGWARRWRLRRDFPLLPWIERPSRP